jgi:wyosine [tRNA(Phe)-imidazoG37] synthetase (radical SAM superfamily)
MRYIYGPVYSWRLGHSLGVDLLSQTRKICTFGCSYCQIGKKTSYTLERKIFVPTAEIIREIKNIPGVYIDYITFSGRGEPTLAKNLGEVIRRVKKIRKEKIAVLTNSSLLYRKDVRKALLPADLVACKLDAASPSTFAVINKGAKGVKLSNIIDGIKQFRKIYKGRLALQIMFLKGNMNQAPEVARLAKSINPDEVQLNTPLRHKVYGALSKKEMSGIMKYFKAFNVTSVYDKPKKSVAPINRKETSRRRG